MPLAFWTSCIFLKNNISRYEAGRGVEREDMEIHRKGFGRVAFPRRPILGEDAAGFKGFAKVADLQVGQLGELPPGVWTFRRRPKGENRIAQGFSPGKTSPTESP
jgi:hypothetical protein